MNKLPKFVWVMAAVMLCMVGMSHQAQACDIAEDILQDFIGVDTIVVSAKEKMPDNKSVLMILHDRIFGNPLDVLTADMIKKVGVEYLKDSLSANHVQIVDSSVPPPLKFPNKVEQRNVLFVHFEYSKRYGGSDAESIAYIRILIRRNDSIPRPISSTAIGSYSPSVFRIFWVEAEPESVLPQRTEKAIRDGLSDLTTYINCALSDQAQE